MIPGQPLHDSAARSGLQRGMAYGVAAYAIWGLFPLYWVLLASQGADEILAHRVVWSLVTCLVVLAVTRRLGRLGHLDRGVVGLLAVGGLFITVNWGLFIWATTNGQVVEASLGYFINPLVSVVLGVMVKKERLPGLQWVAVGLAACGVIALTIHIGTLPWVSLVLAVSFGTYGLVKSSVRAPALEGLTVETLVLVVPAIAWLWHVGGAGVLASGDASLIALAIGAGPATAVPLLLFAGAARRLPLTTLGLLQYITPTGQLLVGVLLLDETFDMGQLLGFGIIWMALAIFAVDRMRRMRSSLRASAVASST